MFAVYEYRLTLGSGSGSVVERRTRDLKVIGSRPEGAAGEFSSPWSAVCADSYLTIIILIKRYSLTRVNLTALYKHLITKTTLT